MEMSVDETRAFMIAAVERDLARLEAMDEALRLAPPSQRELTGSSVVYTVRLDPREVATLHAQAAAAGIKPTVLARNLIRIGLSAPNGSLDGVALAQAVDRVEKALRELRTLVA